MKKLIVLLIGIVFIIVVYSIPSLREKAHMMLTYSACDTPLHYKIGNVDTRYNLSNDEVLTDTGEASAIWDHADGGKKLFIYDETSPSSLTINFVYDKRTALNNQINNLENQVQQKDKTLESQINAYKQRSADFRVRIDAYKTKLDAYNEKANYYNNQGGAPEDIYKQLQQDQADLQKEQVALSAEANQLDETAKNLNLSTEDYNSDVKNLNQSIDVFGNALNKKPEEGLFDPNNNTISIYFNNSHNELVHTLAHELGHYLGMDHVNDTNAIMYPYTTNSLVVTNDDLQQLMYICRRQSVIIHDIIVFDTWIATELKKIGIKIYR